MVNHCVYRVRSGVWSIIIMYTEGGQVCGQSSWCIQSKVRCVVNHHGVYRVRSGVWSIIMVYTE